MKELEIQVIAFLTMLSRSSESIFNSMRYTDDMQNPSLKKEPFFLSKKLQNFLKRMKNPFLDFYFLRFGCSKFSELCGKKSKIVLKDAQCSETDFALNLTILGFLVY